MKSIELLNSEGPILILEKSNDFFVLKNGHKKVLGCLSKKEVSNFLNGDLSVVDSDTGVINYLNYPDSMKTENQKVFDFMDQ